MRHLYLQWGAHAVVDCALEVLLEHGGTLMGYMVMVPTLYMATTGSAVRMSGAAAVSAAGRRVGPRLLPSGVQAIATHGDHSPGTWTSAREATRPRQAPQRCRICSI